LRVAGRHVSQRAADGLGRVAESVEQVAVEAAAAESVVLRAGLAAEVFAAVEQPRGAVQAVAVRGAGERQTREGRCLAREFEAGVADRAELEVPRADCAVRVEARPELPGLHVVAEAGRHLLDGQTLASLRASAEQEVVRGAEVAGGCLAAGEAAGFDAGLQLRGRLVPAEARRQLLRRGRPGVAVHGCGRADEKHGLGVAGLAEAARCGTAQTARVAAALELGGRGVQSEARGRTGCSVEALHGPCEAHGVQREACRALDTGELGRAAVAAGSAGRAGALSEEVAGLAGEARQGSERAAAAVRVQRVAAEQRVFVESQVRGRRQQLCPHAEELQAGLRGEPREVLSAGRAGRRVRAAAAARVRAASHAAGRPVQSEAFQQLQLCRRAAQGRPRDRNGVQEEADGAGLAGPVVRPAGCAVRGQAAGERGLTGVCEAEARDFSGSRESADGFLAGLEDQPEAPAAGHAAGVVRETAAAVGGAAVREGVCRVRGVLAQAEAGEVRQRHADGQLRRRLFGQQVSGDAASAPAEVCETAEPVAVRVCAALHLRTRGQGVSAEAGRQVCLGAGGVARGALCFGHGEEARETRETLAEVCAAVSAGGCEAARDPRLLGVQAEAVWQGVCGCDAGAGLFEEQQAGLAAAAVARVEGAAQAAGPAARDPLRDGQQAFAQVGSVVLHGERLLAARRGLVGVQEVACEAAEADREVFGAVPAVRGRAALEQARRGARVSAEAFADVCWGDAGGGLLVWRGLREESEGRWSRLLEAVFAEAVVPAAGGAGDGRGRVAQTGLELEEVAGGVRAVQAEASRDAVEVVAGDLQAVLAAHEVVSDEALAADGRVCRAVPAEGVSAALGCRHVQRDELLAQAGRQAAFERAVVAFGSLQEQQAGQTPRAAGRAVEAGCAARPAADEAQAPDAEACLGRVQACLCFGQAGLCERAALRVFCHREEEVVWEAVAAGRVFLEAVPAARVCAAHEETRVSRVSAEGVGQEARVETGELEGVLGEALVQLAAEEAGPALGAAQRVQRAGLAALAFAGPDLEGSLDHAPAFLVRRGQAQGASSRRLAVALAAILSAGVAVAAVASAVRAVGRCASSERGRRRAGLHSEACRDARVAHAGVCSVLCESEGDRGTRLALAVVRAAEAAAEDGAPLEREERLRQVQAEAFLDRSHADRRGLAGLPQVQRLAREVVGRQALRAAVQRDRTAEAARSEARQEEGCCRPVAAAESAGAVAVWDGCLGHAVACEAVRPVELQGEARRAEQVAARVREAREAVGRLAGGFEGSGRERPASLLDRGEQQLVRRGEGGGGQDCPGREAEGQREQQLELCVIEPGSPVAHGHREEVRVERVEDREARGVAALPEGQTLVRGGQSGQAGCGAAELLRELVGVRAAGLLREVVEHVRGRPPAARDHRGHLQQARRDQALLLAGQARALQLEGAVGLLRPRAAHHHQQVFRSSQPESLGRIRLQAGQRQLGSGQRVEEAAVHRVELQPVSPEEQQAGHVVRRGQAGHALVPRRVAVRAQAGRTRVQEVES